MQCMVNVKRAMAYACTAHALRTKHGCLTHSGIVMALLQRLNRNKLFFYIRESSTAQELGVGMRLQSGLKLSSSEVPKGKGKKGKKKGSESVEQVEVPPQLKRELDLGLAFWERP